jgi:phage-related protein
MRALKRVLAVIVMVVSILVLLLSLAGIVGTWIVRGELSTALVGIVTNAETLATSAKQGLDQLDATLAQAGDQVAALEQGVQTLGTNVEQNKPLLTALSDKLNAAIGPLLDKASELMTSLGEAVAAVNSAIEAINAIPFLSVNIPQITAVDTLSQSLESLRSEVQTLLTAIDEKSSEIVNGVTSVLTTPLSKIGSTLDQMQAAISGFSQQVGDVQQGLANLKSAIPIWLTWGAVILTVILLWLALSQAALFVLGWRGFSGLDILPRGQKELPTSS